MFANYHSRCTVTPCIIKKLNPLLFHHIFALTATNCTNISRSTQEVLLVVNME